MGEPELPHLIGPSLGDTPSAGAPGDGARATRGLSSALPPDLLQQVRGRVRLLAMLVLIAFGFDPFIFAVRLLILAARGEGLPPDAFATIWFQVVYLVTVAASAVLWWVARNRRVSAGRLHTLGLGYEVVICYTISFTTIWQYYLSNGLVPNMNWVPGIVILFPLVLPGPPRRMLAAAVAAAASTPVALWVLEQTGRITADSEAYVQALVHATFAVVFAYLGAQVVYGLGREVVRARELGSYQLGELLGRGGMGEVYRATHRMLARPAAIKLIRPEMLGAGDPLAARMAIQRFRREAEAAARLRSPHTVELYDFGVTADQTFYFVMELLEGDDLESLVRRKGPLPAARVIYLLRQVCESLEEAHVSGLVHRDIKPANIHVGRLGLRYDFVKVLDFGLVKSLAAGPEHTLQTAGGQVPGTPAYMAPEVALGESFDGRADLYALGCVAYFLLTGQLVFEAPNPLGVIARHMRDVPAAPSARSELPVPAELDRLVLRCLAKVPAERPESAAELSRLLSEVPVEPWDEPQARAWWQRHQLAPAAAAVAG